MLDWSRGPRYRDDQPKDLRTVCVCVATPLLEKHMPACLSQHVASQTNKPLFDDREVAWLRDAFTRVFPRACPLPISKDWDFSVEEGQPYCLSALERLSTLLTRTQRCFQL